MKSQFSDLLHNFGKTIGLPDLAPDETGYCCLMFDENVVNIEFDEATEQVFLYSNVGDLPKEGREGLYEMLLEANYFFRGTRGATLSVDTGSDRVVAAYQVPLGALGNSQFESTVENFVHVTESWKKKLCEFQMDAGQSSEPPVPLTVKV
jgi:hypothetical protein